MIAIIPARGGSKGLPNKNKKIIAGKPLIQWTIDAAKKSKYIKKIIISSDDSEIHKIANSNNVLLHKRSSELSNSQALMTDVIKKILLDFKNIIKDELILLQPTSPLRSYKHIDDAISTYRMNNHYSLISMYEPTGIEIAKSYLVNDCGRAEPAISSNYSNMNRQNLPKILLPNGAIYIFNKNHLLKNNSISTNQVYPFIMAEDISIDIDDINDFKLAEEKLLK